MEAKDETKFLRAAELEGWDNLADFVGLSKKVGSYHVELIGATDRGAIINIWENEKSTLHHVWTPSDDGEWRKLDEVNFMHFRNAKDEFHNLKLFSDVVDLLCRNT